MKKIVGKESQEMRIRHWAGKFLVGVCAALFCAASAVTAFGASTVGNLAITVKEGESEGTLAEPVIRVSPSSCVLAEVSWSKPVEEWKPGKLVYGYLTITADEGRVFEQNYSSSKCSVSGADFRSAFAEGEDKGTLKVTIRYIPVLKLGMTEEAGWSDARKTKAKWKKVPYATQYELRLYQDDVWVKTVETTATAIDLSPYLKEEGSYFYEVRAKGKTAEEGKYLLAGEYVPSSDVLMMDAEELGAIGGTWRHYQEGKKYQEEDGSFSTGQWKLILRKWYYFDENGYAVTGWFQDEASGHWYHMDEQGELETGWKKLDQDWYYFRPEGQMATGWIQDGPNQWYYLNPDGSMAVDTVVEGKYSVGSDGKCLNPDEGLH